jgi:polyisoprenoid-binding protein YceI
MTYQLRPANGTLLLRTRREGLAAGLGHDLTLALTRWSATVDGESSVSVTVELESLEVREGTGGALPLTDTDRRDIRRNALKSLKVDRYGSATYHSTAVTRTSNGYVVEGDLTLAGATKPVRLMVAERDSLFVVTAEILQSAFGIKPYSAFFGALKLRDPVAVELSLSDVR